MHLPQPHSPSGSRRPRNRRRTNSGVDIKAINARLERWADEIKDKFKIRRVKGKGENDDELEIYSSVFQPPDWIRPATREQLDALMDDDEAAEGRLLKEDFDGMVESVRTAIELGMHPSLIAQGSSGSYFARDSGGKVLGVFKPKDEEPYASKNPKWTKWIHRNLLPFAFGRAMLIPNLSYVSEAAAYVLDCQLRTGLVPYTDVVELSSKSFHYDYWERRAFYRKKKALPHKPGSFQVFLKGYKGATEFFKDHPWPDQQANGTLPDLSKRRKKKRRRWDQECRPSAQAQVVTNGAEGGSDHESEDDEGTEEQGLTDGERIRKRKTFWSPELQQSFREQLERLVILDYIMRNTDRGTDNWMIRIDTETQTATIVTDPPKQEGEDDGYSRREETMTANVPQPKKSEGTPPQPHIGAIDNSLSWPWKHPDAWRSYPFGWLFLPVSLIGRPFSAATKKHFLPLLTSKVWWMETREKLRHCFEMDSDFQERMFERQMAVMKGQAWNVVETLKDGGELGGTGGGPLELARRGRVMVWDDVVEVPVAQPLSRPSQEMSRTNSNGAREAGIEEEEEMDISAALHDDNQASIDLLGLMSPSREAGGNPFNESRSSHDISIPKANGEQLTPPRPNTTRAKSHSHAPPRFSLDTPRSKNPWQQRGSPPSPSGRRRRRFSFSVGRRGSEDDGDGGGDLGFAAAGMREREGVKRKVVVERLEVVKGRGPVFTWC